MQSESQVAGEAKAAATETATLMKFVEMTANQIVKDATLLDVEVSGTDVILTFSKTPKAEQKLLKALHDQYPAINFVIEVDLGKTIGI
jgi:hypothetical protein